MVPSSAGQIEGKAVAVVAVVAVSVELRVPLVVVEVVTRRVLEVEAVVLLVVDVVVV